MNTSTGIKKSLKGGQSVPALAPGASDSSVATITLFSDTIAATYFLQACADAPKNVSEDNRDEQLRQCRADAHRAAGAEPPGQLDHESPRDRHPRGELHADELGAERGLGRRGHHQHTKYYLVSTVDGAKKDLQGTQVVPALNGGQTFSTQQTLTVREETLRGQYKVQACADGGNDAVESLEDDNCLTLRGHRQGGGAAGSHRDAGDRQERAALGGARRAPHDHRGGEEPGRGRRAAVDAQVPARPHRERRDQEPGRHQGLRAHQAGHDELAAAHRDRLPRHAVGTYLVQACADSLDKIPEVSETNNCLTSTGTITVQ